MRPFALAFLLIPFIFGCTSKPTTAPTETQIVCNPMNLSYRFCLDEPSRREAADPTIVWFKDRYYLFASKSGGYWHSNNLSNWIFIETSQIPTEEYAPTAVAIGDTLYFLASSNAKSTVYKSNDPLSGQWQVAVEQLSQPVWDPAFLLDDDQRLYLYWGCSNVNPLYGVEIDYRNNFSFKGEPLSLLKGNPEAHGWEVPGDYNTLTGQAPWIEGAWVNKINGKYYFQYSGPGTEYKSYSDGVYVAENPLGPYTLQKHNPFAYKPEGFAAGAGHGSSFTDQYGNWWHIGTMTISVKHMFERRLGLFPVFLDDNGTFYCSTWFGDYPFTIPKKKINSPEELFPGWMLLSYNKTVEVSSEIDTLPASNMTDENIRTYWAAASGNAGEYALLDLGDNHDVLAVQINFAEHNTRLFGRKEGLKHRYTIECSSDKTNWKSLCDQSEAESDLTHNFISLKEKAVCRYLRITNIEVPGGHFALSGFRVFGLGHGTPPDKVEHLNAIRNSDNRRSITLSWNKPAGAKGYNIRYGVEKDQLYLNYQVYADTSLTLNSLNTESNYWFSIEAFNENGISTGEEIISVE
jgi:xylan 1,4-beta-xylosidase